MEINGFEIEKYNQYGLKENAKHSTCPLCSADRKKSTDECTSLNWTTGIGTCHHCNTSFQLHTFKRKYNKERIVYVRPEQKKLTALSEKMIAYFASRKISENTLKLMKIGEGVEWMPSKNGQGGEVNTIQFNYFLFDELVNIKYRSANKDFKMFKDAERIFYNIDSIRLSSEAIIVEGEFDALSFVEIGRNEVVSIPNGSTIGTVNLSFLDEYLDYFENKEVIYLALDNDEAGQNVQAEFIRRLGAEKCKTVDFSVYSFVDKHGETKACKDANDILVHHGKDALEKCIQDAKDIPLEGVSGILDFRDDFEAYVKKGLKHGFECGIPSLDAIFSTYTRQYIVVTGQPSSGKSELVDQMCIGYAQKYGWKIALASKENKPNELHAGKIMAKLTGHWVSDVKYFQEQWYEESLNWMHDHFKFIDFSQNYSIDAVLKLGTEMVKRYGIKVLVVDPYNKTPLESKHNNVNEATTEYLLKIDEWCAKNDALVILVAHPVKPSKDDRKNYEPNMYDIKGGGEFYDMSPHGLAVVRDFGNDFTKVRVLKVKFHHLGDNGGECFLRWSSRSGRYNECEPKFGDEIGKEIPNNDNYFTKTDTMIYEKDKSLGYELPPLKPNVSFSEPQIEIEIAPF